MDNLKPERLGSLDVLRGFDLFCLVFLQPMLEAYTKASNFPFLSRLSTKFDHVPWDGFVFRDLMMPLFMFMAGVSMPFAFAKLLRTQTKLQVYKRIIKRVSLLFLFGMICQGNLLSFDPNQIYLYSNILQAIAVGYLISAILLNHFQVKEQFGNVSFIFLILWPMYREGKYLKV